MPRSPTCGGNWRASAHDRERRKAGRGLSVVCVMIRAMSLAPYREILALPGVLRLMVFAVFARLPHAATTIVLTLYVVLGMDRGYAAAGLVAACSTVGAAAGAPWRGRALDRMGLRRTVLPSVVIESACWAAVPFVDYHALLLVAVLAGLMSVPTFTVVRQSISVLVPVSQQGPAFTLDSIGTEITYMIAPSAGVILATSWSSKGTVWVVGAVTVLAGIALLVVNPPIRSAASPGDVPADTRAEEADEQPVPGRRVILRQIFSREMIFVLAATVAALAVLAATEVGVVAFLREHGQSQLSSIVFVLWSVASIAGGLVLGSRRQLPVFGVLMGLGVLTIPVGLVPNGWWLLLAILPTGFFCAPALSATAAAVSRLVPEHIRGEAMGWYGTAMTVGLTIGAPVAGWAIDQAGAWAGFAVIGVLGAGVAVIGLVLVAWGIDRPGPSGPGAPSGVSPTRRLRSAA
jgi:MFS family permease